MLEDVIQLLKVEVDNFKRKRVVLHDNVIMFRSEDVDESKTMSRTTDNSEQKSLQQEKEKVYFGLL